jgi:homoserine/homoserine lactone efflux protein
MGTETLLIVAAASLLVLLLPSPAGRMLRDYSLSCGRGRGLALLPTLWLGYVAAGILAGTSFLILHAVIPAISGSLSWLAIAYIAIFALRAQRQRLTFRIADNDNLPDRRYLRAALRMLIAAPRPSLVLALLAVLLQVTVAQQVSVETVGLMGLAFAVAALVAPIVQCFAAERSARKIRQVRQENPASHKPPTRFIVSRAVTAGYRRIAA